VVPSEETFGLEILFLARVIMECAYSGGWKTRCEVTMLVDCAAEKAGWTAIKGGRDVS
jgi:hypothetical protein